MFQISPQPEEPLCLPGWLWLLELSETKSADTRKVKVLREAVPVKFFAEGYGLVLSMHRHSYLKIQRISEIYKGKIFSHEFSIFTL